MTHIDLDARHLPGLDEPAPVSRLLHGHARHALVLVLEVEVVVLLEPGAGPRVLPPGNGASPSAVCIVRLRLGPHLLQLRVLLRVVLLLRWVGRSVPKGICYITELEMQENTLLYMYPNMVGQRKDQHEFIRFNLH